MKRKIMSALLIASMVVGLAACGNTGGSNGGTATGDNNASAGADENSASTKQNDGSSYKMEISCSNADETVLGKILIHFEELVEEKSNGQIQVERYMNGTICSTIDEPATVSAGTITAAYCSGPAASAAGVTMEDLYNIPFLVTTDLGDASLMTAIEKDETISEMVQNQIDEKGLNIHRLGDLASSLGSFSIANNKKPVKSIHDAQGLKIRTPGGVYYNMLLEEMGADGQSISVAELPVALQQGVVDGLCTNPTYYNDSMLHTKYLTMPYVFSNTMPFYINKDWWDSLPEDLQCVLESAYEESVDYAMDLCATGEKEALDEIENEHGVEVDYLDLDSDEGKAFKEDLMQKGIDQYVSDNGENGQKAVDRVLEIRKELGL